MTEETNEQKLTTTEELTGTGEAAEADAVENTEAADAEKTAENTEAADKAVEEKTADKKAVKRVFAAGMTAGVLAGVALCLLGAFLYRGYITFPSEYRGQKNIIFPYYDMLHSNSGSRVDTTELVRKTEEINNLIEKTYLYEADAQTMADSMFTGMAYGLTDDAYIAYYSKENYAEEKKKFTGSYSGIGVTIVKDPDERGVLIKAVAPGGPAEEAKLLPGDIIVSADGFSLAGLDSNACVERIAGGEGTSVLIGVLRDGETFEVSVVRRKIVTITVRGSMYPNSKIGIISVNEFKNETEFEFGDILDDLVEDQEAHGIVIDLRNNGGGDMNVALRMIDKILKDDDTRYNDGKSGKNTDLTETDGKGRTLLLKVEDKHGNCQRYYAGDKRYRDIPVVCLVNETSASASEIFAGVLRDYGYTIVGTKTFGKGIVQTVYQLADGSAIKFTTDEYRLPAGDLIHGVGIEPTVYAPFVPFGDVTSQMVNYAGGAETDISMDEQLKTAVNVLRDMLY